MPVSTAFFASPVTVFHLPGTTGWDGAYHRIPTADWVLPDPVILPAAPGQGFSPDGFGFAISWAKDATVVVEAASTPNSPVWSPISTHTIRYAAGSSEVGNGWTQVHDPGWKDYPSRFYRVRQQ